MGLQVNKYPQIGKLGLMFFLLLIIFIMSICTGSVEIPLNEVASAIFSPSATTKSYQVILWQYRLPKALTAILAGAGLAVSGLQMQTLFRNPLAGPFVLGISSGATLGVALFIMGASALSLSTAFIAGWGLAATACIGASAVLLLIFMVSFRIKDIMALLILGIMFGSAATAIVSVLQYFSNELVLRNFVIWTLGSVSDVSFRELKVMSSSILIGLTGAFILSKQMNAFLLGEDYAKSMGVNIFQSRMFIILTTGILAGTITAFCGPIGFVGIAVPHICRMVFQTSDHRFLVPSSIILGAIFILTCDIVSRLPGEESILPINAITAIVGAPIVIWIILKKKNFSASFA